MTDHALIADFADETREHLEALESSLLQLASDPTNRELLDAIFRCMHTIKGASEYLGFERIARLTHRLEHLLDHFREGRLQADQVAVDLLIDAGDRIGKLVAQVEDTGQESADIDDLTQRAASIASVPSPEGTAADAPAVYAGEADTELFNIFMDQLTEGIQALLAVAGRLSSRENVDEAVAEMADHLDRLAGTANYMGYDTLSAVYATMLAELGTVGARLPAASVPEVNAFMQSTVVDGVQRIQDLFPHAESLASIDTRIQTNDPALLADFARETREHLQALEKSLGELVSDPTNREHLDTVFRCMHTIKGASEYLGIERIARLTHCLENLLRRFREGSVRADKVSLDLLIDAGDRIGDLIAQIEETGHESAAIDDLTARAAGLVSTVIPADEAAGPDVNDAREADTELFAIFMEQLTEGIETLMVTAARITRGDDDNSAVAEMTDQLGRLAGTANYMGYDELLAVYGKMQADIEAFSSRSVATGTEDQASLTAIVTDGVERIRDLFPTSKSLAALATVPLAVNPDSGETPTRTSGADSLPAGDTDHPKDLANVDADEDGQADLCGLSIGSDGEVDLWPEAPEASTPASDAPSAAPQPNLPVIDLSTPAPSQPPADPETEPAPTIARSEISKRFRVDADKVDDLMNQVGELVVNRAAFVQLSYEMGALSHYLGRRYGMVKADQRMLADITSRLSVATTGLARVSSDLQDQVMKVRMMPVSRLFNRYPRLVHELVKDAHKKIQLHFRGEDTELDRMVIEQLADPMIHIIRNAVGHGIETTVERKRKGKPESGILLLEAYHEGSHVIIEITDDGKGIDLSRIRQKAVEKQLANHETLARMDPSALINMILLPGFSTADRITHTSGRGVGMDVVKRNIENIGGSLDVETRQDVGTRIRIKIPLTLAIIPALMVRCAGCHFTIPMSAVQETLRIDRGEIFSVDGREMIHLHDAPMPLVSLSDLLNLQASLSPQADSRVFVVVVNAAAGRIGFLVDRLLSRQEVVVKPLDDYLQVRSGCSGATILGDGAISLILDMDELAVMAREQEVERKLAAAML